MSLDSIFLVLSIGLPVLIVMFEVWCEFSKSSSGKKWMLTLIIAAGAGFSLYLSLKAEKKNELLQQAELESQEVIRKTYADISDQSKVLDRSFSEMDAQFAASGIRDESLLSTFKSLQDQVTKFSNDSKDYLELALNNRTSREQEPENMISVQPVSNDNFFRAKPNDAVIIDPKNQFSVFDDKLDKYGSIKVMLNGHSRKMKPGGRLPFTNNKGVHSFLVFKEIDKDEVVFYVHER